MEGIQDIYIKQGKQLSLRIRDFDGRMRMMTVTITSYESPSLGMSVDVTIPEESPFQAMKASAWNKGAPIAPSLSTPKEGSLIAVHTVKNGAGHNDS